MTKEQIKKAVDEYIGYSPEMDEGIETTMRRNAFKDGADWRINSVWHKPEEVPEVDRCIIMDNITEWNTWVVNLSTIQCWKRMVRDYDIVRWAYIDDLIPDKDETA